MSKMGDDIETNRFRLLSCTILVAQKSKQTAPDDRPEPISVMGRSLSYECPIFCSEIVQSRKGFKPETPLPDYDAAVADGDDV